MAAVPTARCPVCRAIAPRKAALAGVMIGLGCAAGIGAPPAMAAPPPATSAAPPSGPPPSAYGPPPAGSPYGAEGSPYGLQAPPPGQPVTAGGLSAPPPLDEAVGGEPAASETERQLDEAAEEDAGRGLDWFWLDVEGGYQHVGLATFTTDADSLSAGLQSSTANGGFVGAGIGAQLLYFTIGPRFRLGFFSPWQMYSVDGELGLRIPLGRLEPHIALAGGYTARGSVSAAPEAAPEAVRIHGFNARAGGGLDIYLTEVLFLGAGVSFELLGLIRPELDAAGLASLRAEGAVSEAEAELLAAEGSGYGSALTVGGKMGLRF